MLGKLFKHEFKSTYKVMLIIYGILTAVTVLGMIVLSLYDIANANASPTADILTIDILVIVYFLVYALSIFAFMIITYVYITLRFYKSMYSAQGYLTHTLPVKPLTTFHVKATVSAIWLLLVNVLTYLSIFGLLYSLLSPMLWEIAMPDVLQEMEAMFMSIYGLTSGELLVYILLSSIISPVLMVLMIAFACSIGQLFSRQKVAASVVAGIILYFINQTINSILSTTQLISTDLGSATALADTYGPMLWTSLAISTVFAVICYIGSNIIVRKHINLE